MAPTAAAIEKETDTAELAERRAERAYWIDALQTWCRDRYSLELLPLQTDDSAVPPAALVSLIQDPRKSDPDVFLGTGARDQLTFLRELHDHGYDPTRFNRILDMGCGLSRITRHWLPFTHCEIHGCDITDPVLDYSRALLSDRVRYSRTNPDPPLPYEDASFDFLFASSVFTHVSPDRMEAWVNELARVLRPGAALILIAFEPHVQMRGFTEREFDRLMQSNNGVQSWGSDAINQSFRYATDQAERRLWSSRFDVLEIRQQFKNGRHIIMRRR